MVFDKSNISIIRSLFSNNGGGVLCASNNSTVDILSSTFSQNTAKSNGGVIYLNTDVNVSIASSEFVENSAGENGGVVMVKTTSCWLFPEAIFLRIKRLLQIGIWEVEWPVSRTISL